MKNTIGSFKLVRVLIIAMLVIPLAMGTVSPALADVETVPAGILSVGENHTCALKPSGAVDCWGWDILGQVSGTGENIRFATHPGPYTQVSAGEWHTCALKPDGAVDCWGNDSFGQVSGIGPTSRFATHPGPYTQVSVGANHTCALKPDGALDCWGDDRERQAADKPGPYTQVSAGQSHTCALTPSGAVDCWGKDNFGQAADQTGPYTEVSAAQSHTCALTAVGAIDCWGTDEKSQVTGARDLTAPYYPLFATHPGPYTQVSAGEWHTCALKSDGAVDCWGDDFFDQVSGIGPTSRFATHPGPYARVSAGTRHSCALTPLGAVQCWGYNSDGQTDGKSGPYGPYDPNSNTAPTASPGGPYLGAVNTSIAFDGSASSDPDSNPLTYAWDFGDSSATGTGVTRAHSYMTGGVYNVCLTVNDGSVSSDPACTLAIVYDPSAGFVTGGGWLNSPAGAYRADGSQSGQATFGFFAKYKRGETIPSGSTAFKFDLAGMAFSSQSYEWLVVNQSGTNAQFKGTGLINGVADPNGNAYRFILWAGDGSPDTFRIRIWWEDAAGEHDVYDNGTAQAIGAGNVVVHTGK